MADHHDHIDIEASGHPLRGDQGDGILDQGQDLIPAILGKGAVLSPSLGQTTLRAPEGHTTAPVVAPLDHRPDRRIVGGLVVRADIGEEAFEGGIADVPSGSRPGIEGFEDVIQLWRFGEHPAHPGGPGARGPCHQDGPAPVRCGIGWRLAMPLAGTLIHRRCGTCRILSHYLPPSSLSAAGLALPGAWS